MQEGDNKYRDKEVETLRRSAKVMIRGSARLAGPFAPYFPEGFPCLAHLLLLRGAAPLSQKEDNSCLNLQVPTMRTPDNR